MKLRPNVAELVTCLGKQAVDWDGFMPPCAPTNDFTPSPSEPESDSFVHREFAILILLDVVHQVTAQAVSSRRRTPSEGAPQNHKLPLGHSVIRTPYPLVIANHHRKGLW